MSSLALKDFSDEAVIKEAAKRLQEMFKNSNGITFKHGKFEFIFRDGFFQGVEEKPSFRLLFYKENEG